MDADTIMKSEAKACWWFYYMGRVHRWRIFIAASLQS